MRSDLIRDHLRHNLVAFHSSAISNLSAFLRFEISFQAFLAFVEPLLLWLGAVICHSWATRFQCANSLSPFLIQMPESLFFFGPHWVSLLLSFSKRNASARFDLFSPLYLRPLVDKLDFVANAHVEAQHWPWAGPLLKSTTSPSLSSVSGLLGPRCLVLFVYDSSMPRI